MSEGPVFFKRLEVDVPTHLEREAMDPYPDPTPLGKARERLCLYVFEQSAQLADLAARVAERRAEAWEFAAANAGEEVTPQELERLREKADEMTRDLAYAKSGFRKQKRAMLVGLRERLAVVEKLARALGASVEDRRRREEVEMRLLLLAGQRARAK